MVPTPMVMARRGILSTPPNAATFCWSVVGVRALTRVRERRAERGSLKPMWPGFADAEELQVNAAEPLDRRLVAAAFLVQVFRQAVGQVGVPRINVHMAEQVVVHVVAVGVGVRREQGRRIHPG